ncbi:MAG TPA: hypothetical protein VEB21_20235, partial [Terriglobales bacterium]|nr:hypothetical protein [Terriglobales bacterium]
NDMLISAGNQMGLLATRGKVDFGGEPSERPLEIDAEFANANGAVTIAFDAPYVGPKVCSDNLLQLCSNDAQCFGNCVAGTCSDDGVTACSIDDQCRGTCSVRRRINDGVCSNNPATPCIVNADCGGANTCQHPFTSSNGQIGAGLMGTGSSLNFKLCDNALTLLTPSGVPLGPSPLQLAIENFVPGPGQGVTLGGSNCRLCPLATSADASCTPCPPNLLNAKTKASTKKIILTVGGGLQVIDLSRVAIVGNSILELRGQDDTLLVIRVNRSLRIGGEAKVVLASNNSGNGTLQPSSVLWVAKGRAGGVPNLYRACTFRGTLLASGRQGIRVGASVLVEGGLYGRRVSIGGQSIVQHYPFKGLLPLP